MRDILNYSLSDSDLKQLGKRPPHIKGFQPCDISILTYEELRGKTLETILATSETRTVVLLY